MCTIIMGIISHRHTPCQKRNFFHQKRKGFTLIEVLIAIFVMGIGILSIVSLMAHNISIIKKVHLQTTATTLAREGMEMVTNIRDTNTMLGYERDCAERTPASVFNTSTTTNNNGLETLCKTFFRTGCMTSSRFTIDGGLLPHQKQIEMKKISGTDLWSTSSLFLTGVSINGMIVTGYTHQGGTATSLHRYIEFTGMSGLPANSPILNTKHPQILPVKSVVQYEDRGRTGQVVFESFLANQE